MARNSKYSVKIERSVPIRLYPLTKFFKGLEKVEALHELFGNKTEEVLKETQVEFFSSRWGYMGVNETDGHVLISAYHMRHSPFRTLYLDILHELFHTKQLRDGKKLFLDEFDYFDSPVEIEAYEFTIKEARRIGMTDREIIDYLEVPWADKKQLTRFIRKLGLKT